MHSRSRAGPFSTARLAFLVLAVSAPVAPAGLAQDEGEVMRIFERAERQVRRLNETSSLASAQMVATRDAVTRFTAAGSPAEIEAATERALAEFRKNENALENLTGLLRDLSESFSGLGAIADSNEGARQLEALGAAVDNADAVFSRLAEGGGLEGAEAQLSGQQLNLVRARLESDRRERLRAEADRHRAAAESSPSNVERLGEVLARLSVLAELVEVRNSVNRELVLALALRNAPNLEKKEALTGIIGDFGAPDEMVARIEELSTAMTEATVSLIGGLVAGGAGFPDFTEEEVNTALNMLNRPREVTCEQCTDGIDNDLDGLIDAAEGPGCRLFIDMDPTCAAANTGR